MTEQDTIALTSPSTLTRSSPPSDTSAQQEQEKANSVRNGEANDSTSSSEEDRPLKPTKTVKLPHQYAPPTANTDSLQDDLEDFDFDPRKVKDLMSKRESFFDATMQRPHFQTREDRENERKRLLNGSVRATGSRPKPNGIKPVGVATRGEQRPVKKRKVSGEGLVIKGSGSANWILFDPNFDDFPLKSGFEAPALFQRFMRFEPGNARIVEINRASGCIRLKSTPESLEGKDIVYTNEGPKVIEAKPVTATTTTAKPAAVATTTTTSTTAGPAAENIGPTTEAPPPPPPPSKRDRGSSRSRGRGRSSAITNGGAPSRTSPRTRVAKVDSGYEDSSPGRGKRGRKGGGKTRSRNTITGKRKQQLEEPMVEVKREERDSGSESSLTSFGEGGEVEIADSQEREEGVGS